MYYSAIDFHDSLLECEFDPHSIDRVTSAWGQEEDPWSGGFCFETFDREYFRLVKHEDGSATLEKGEQELDPPIEDYEDNPSDLQHWVEEGSPEEDLIAF